MRFSTVATLLTASAVSIAAAPILDERATGIQVYLSNLGYVYGYPAGADPSKEYVCSTAALVSSSAPNRPAGRKGKDKSSLLIVLWV